jgi:hypothetical protein
LTADDGLRTGDRKGLERAAITEEAAPGDSGLTPKKENVRQSQLNLCIRVEEEQCR